MKGNNDLARYGGPEGVPVSLTKSDGKVGLSTSETPPRPSRGPTVYLVSQPSISRNKNDRGPNLEPLKDHGPVQVLVRSGEAPAFEPDRVLKLIERRLDGYDPNLDFLAFAGGDSLALFLTGVVIADMASDQGFEMVTWLRYERFKQPDGSRTHMGAKYIPVRVPLYPIDETLREGTNG